MKLCVSCFLFGLLVGCTAAAEANAPSGCDRRLVLCQLDLAVCTARGQSKPGPAER